MDPVDRACALHQQALDRLDAGDPRRARELFTRAHKIFTDLGPSSRGDLANVLVERAVAHRLLGDLAAARTDLERSLELLQSRQRPRHRPPARPRRRRPHRRPHRPRRLHASALQVARRAAKVADKLPAADRAPVFNALGMACKYAAKFKEGLAAYRRAGVAARHAYPAGSLFHATLEHNLGGIHHTAGDARKGRAARAPLRRAPGRPPRPRPPRRPRRRGRPRRGPRPRRALGRGRRAPPPRARRVHRGPRPRHPEVAHATGNYAAHLQLCGRVSEAARLHRKAILLKGRALGDLHPATSLERCNLAELELARGRPDRAAVLFERALAGYRENLGPAHPDTRECRARLAAARRAA
jgi:tetratricopeptide (TPR) repeat protein